MKILVLGMGNPILTNDGVGILVARALEGRIRGTDVVTRAMADLDLLDRMVGYDRVFVIDAMTGVGKGIGDLVVLKEEGPGLHLFSSHGMNFFELLHLGRSLGHSVPEIGGIFGIEIGDEVSFGERLSPDLSEKIKSITERIIHNIQGSISTMR
jgi:hydrogenase maturation protease